LLCLQAQVAFAVVNLLINAFFLGPMDPPGWPWVERLRYISALDYAWQVGATSGCKPAGIKQGPSIGICQLDLAACTSNLPCS